MFEPGTSFSLGINLPWVSYGGDFGANHWRPHGGLAASGIPIEVSAAFRRLGAEKAAVIRWFLFCDGRAGIEFERNGCPAGLDAQVLLDIDVALQAADTANVQIVFSLIDFLWCRRARRVNGVQVQGRRGILARSATRAALIDRVFTPVLKRYGSHPAIAGWEVINEPEWATLGVGTFNPVTSIRRQSMRAFIADTVAAVHASTAQPVTVGLANARWLGLVEGLGLDFYQVHWYDRFCAQWPLTTPVNEFRLEKPVVLGELPTRGSRHAPQALIALARDAGYAGAWLWSLRADDHATDGARALSAIDGASASVTPS